MNNPRSFYWIDLILFVLLLTSFITSFSDSLKELHELSGYLLVTMVAVHLFMHRRWIIAMTKNIFGK